MCGIVGMISSNPAGFNWENTKIFNNLLWVDALRGEDSTGVFGVNKQGNVDYLKTVGDPHTILISSEYKEFKSSIFSDYHMVVGHNRKATRGFITDDNAHPFVEDTTILVHNGTLINHSKLTKEVVDVDSHAILHSIVERGYEKTLADIEGAFTLAWYDTKDKTLRVIRNKERPLYIANTSGAWYFASEKEMLELVLGRENVVIAEMTECKPGMMYFWDLEDKKNMWYRGQTLWSPPKSVTIEQKPEKKAETESTEKTNEAGYDNSDFIIGTKLIFSIDNISTFKKINEQGYSDLFLGTWYFDPVVNTRIWVTAEEAMLFEDLDENSEEPLLVRAEISCVVSKKSKITLVCNKPKPYTPTLDSTQREIYEDEFMLTNRQCDDCKKPMKFEDAQKGVFKYESAIDYVCLCEKCK